MRKYKGKGRGGERKRHSEGRHDAPARAGKEGRREGKEGRRDGRREAGRVAVRKKGREADGSKRKRWGGGWGGAGEGEGKRKVRRYTPGPSTKHQTPLFAPLVYLRSLI